MDQFYTRVDVATSCVEILLKHTNGGVWIEPSAGTGSFLHLVPGAIGYDIDPKSDGIVRADFLETELSEGCVVFGNPPFGRQGSLARKFIQHASRWAAVIGFILPLSFTKPSMQRAFPPCFHLEESWILPKTSFVNEGVPYHVPCVFQVWKRKPVDREIPVPPEPNGFAFVKQPDSHHLAFRRVGGNAGRCSLPHESHNKQCYYFIRLDNPTTADAIVEASLTYPFPTNTTGPRSLSKGEAIQFIHHILHRT